MSDASRSLEITRQVEHVYRRFRLQKIESDGGFTAVKTVKHNESYDESIQSFVELCLTFVCFLKRANMH